VALRPGEKLETGVSGIPRLGRFAVIVAVENTQTARLGVAALRTLKMFRGALWLAAAQDDARIRDSSVQLT
jgi:hypothetical protein